jgi:benzoyl-CoA reductase/2-hydroxyglutaryl-CoA dehydratase subunit BcrC/BadD/HgdB
LKRRGIPSLVVEMEESGLAEGQLRTRFETFMELLRD